MKRPLDKISISGFKSIKALEDFELGKLNIIVGANGAGKSNFVDFFRMLGAMSQEGLQSFITEKGGADGFFFNGPTQTRLITAHLYFGRNQYYFHFQPKVDGLMVKEEGVKYENKNWSIISGGINESRLKLYEKKTSRHGPYLSAEGHVYEAVSNWIVYHFHDTGMTAPMRRETSARDKRRLTSDASNIASFLLYMKQDYKNLYERIVSTVQFVAPFFDDFLLEPETKGQNEVVRLEWKQKGSSFPFQPWQLSDGTIRFICLVTALLQPDHIMPSTILIDEPELGLHPFALDVLAGLIKEVSEQTQVIVSTQSVSLLNHFEPEDVIIVDRENGASVFKRLDKTSLSEWLENYSLGELWQKNVFDGGPRHE